MAGGGNSMCEGLAACQPGQGFGRQAVALGVLGATDVPSGAGCCAGHGTGWLMVAYRTVVCRGQSYQAVPTDWCSYQCMRADGDVFRSFVNQCPEKVKLSTVGIFTPWKPTNATNQGSFICFLPSPVPASESRFTSTQLVMSFSWS